MKKDSIHFERGRAKERGETRYFNGKPCPKGHVADRMVVNGRCCECMREYKLRPEVRKRNMVLVKKDQKLNPEKYAERWATYYKKHGEKLRKKAKANAREKAKRNPYKRKPAMTGKHKKIAAAMRNGVYRALKERKGGKSWQKFVDYTVEELAIHIERQFTNGMSWDNYGKKWHVDHILPVSGFNFTSKDCDEFKLCFALSNMRPLCKIENNKKRAKRTHLI